MKKIFAIVFSFTLLATPSLALAMPEYGDITYGQKSPFTNYPVGACVDNEGGLWQQLYDGTWAPPNDSLNTCKTGGFPQNWMQSPQYNPWLASGQNYQTPSSPYLGKTQGYPWGQDYPGGFKDYNDWFLNCVLMESIFPRPECQAFPRSNYFTPHTQPWGHYNGSYYNDPSIFVSGKIGDDTTIAGRVKLNSSSSSDVVMGLLLGYSLNFLLGKL